MMHARVTGICPNCGKAKTVEVVDVCKCPPARTHPGSGLAKILMQQIDRSGEQSAFWMVSSLHKMTMANPDMPLRDVLQLVRENMPEAWQKYHRYCEST